MMDEVVLSWEEQRAQVLRDILDLQALIDEKLGHLRFIDQMMADYL